MMPLCFSSATSSSWEIVGSSRLSATAARSSMSSRSSSNSAIGRITDVFSLDSFITYWGCNPFSLAICPLSPTYLTSTHDFDARGALLIVTAGSFPVSRRLRALPKSKCARALPRQFPHPAFQTIEQHFALEVRLEIFSSSSSHHLPLLRRHSVQRQHRPS